MIIRPVLFLVCLFLLSLLHSCVCLTGVSQISFSSWHCNPSTLIVHLLLAPLIGECEMEHCGEGEQMCKAGARGRSKCGRRRQRFILRRVWILVFGKVTQHCTGETRNRLGKCSNLLGKRCNLLGKRSKFVGGNEANGWGNEAKSVGEMPRR